MNCVWNQDIVAASLFFVEEEQESGGQQPQTGRKDLGGGGVKSEPRSSNGSQKGLRRSWKAFGKNATMKIARKSRLLRRFVSNGMAVFEGDVKNWLLLWIATIDKKCG